MKAIRNRLKHYISNVIQLLINKVIYYLLYLFTILIILISHFKGNDSKYVLKSDKNKVHILMKKHSDIIVKRVNDKHEQIKKYLLSKTLTINKYKNKLFSK